MLHVALESNLRSGALFGLFGLDWWWCLDFLVAHHILCQKVLQLDACKHAWNRFPACPCPQKKAANVASMPRNRSATDWWPPPQAQLSVIMMKSPWHHVSSDRGNVSWWVYSVLIIIFWYDEHKNILPNWWPRIGHDLKSSKLRPVSTHGSVKGHCDPNQTLFCLEMKSWLHMRGVYLHWAKLW